MTKFNFLGDFLVNPAHAGIVEDTLSRLARPETTEGLTAHAGPGADDDFWGADQWLRPYTVRGGTLVVPVRGVLLPDFPYALGGLATGYAYISAAVSRGVEDPAVERIVLNINSPGGTVQGVLDAADLIYEARAEKPIHAVANEHAYSAAYWLASAATDITVAQTGGVGSIGVISTHVSVAKALDQRGIEYTFIHAGERKLDGQPELPLSEKARESMQARTDALYDIFVAAVARNRGLNEQAVRSTEAGVFMPREAVEAGLADSVGSFDDTLSAFAEPNTNQGVEIMSKDNSAAVQPATPTVAAPEASAPVAAPEASAEALAAARAEGVKAERERVAAIRASEEAVKRPAATEAVVSLDLSAEDAIAHLARLPEEGKADAEPKPAASAPSAFEAAMNGGNPDVGSTPETGTEDEPDRAERAFAHIGVDFKTGKRLSA